MAWGLAVLALTSGVVQAAPLTGTVLTIEGTVVLPGVTTDSAGALIASLSTPWSFTTTAGTTSGGLTTAVFLNATGTLDFYYQIANSADSVTGIERMTAANFAGFLTWTGYRMNANSVSSAGFVDGTVAPYVASRSTNGIVTTFQFGAMPADWVLPGTSSEVLVISTNTNTFTIGNASIIDGGAATVAAYMPFFAIGDVPTPEPESVLLMAAGVAVLAYARLTRRP